MIRWTTAAVLLTAWAGPAYGQVSALDRGKLIDGLSRRGLGKLLLRYVETDPPADPAERLLIEAGQHRADADAALRRSQQLAATDPAAATEAQRSATAAFNAMLETQNRLVDGAPFADRPARVIWMTDLAEMLLFDRLRARENSAAEFYEFGVPTAEQTAAFEEAVPAALRAALRADAALAEVRAQYARDNALRSEHERSQLFFRITEDYGDLRTPLFAAYAGLYAALLPETSPYYTSLGTPRALTVPGQRPDAAQERTRLLQATVERVDQFLPNQSGPAATSAQAVAGRALGKLAGLQSDERQRTAQQRTALERYLQPAVAEGVEGLPGLSASLGEAAVYSAMNNPAAALDTLRAAQANPLVMDNVMYRLLLTDAVFRTRLAQAERTAAAQRAGEVARAYNVYFELLDDPAVRDQQAAVRDYIYRRWAGNLGDDDDVTALPAAVRMAVGQAAREQGQRLLNDDPDAARASLQRAVQVNQTVAGDDQPAPVRAVARFNLALSQVLLDGQSLPNVLGAVERWTQVASQDATQPVAEDAIRFAADFARSLDQQAPGQGGVREQYLETMRVLFERFPGTATAADHRLYYAFAEHQVDGEWEEAAAVYDRVPADHRDYLEAQGLRVYCLSQAYLAALPAERDRLEPTLTNAARRLITDAGRAFERGDDPTQRTQAGLALGAAQLALADAARAKGNYDEALDELAGFERRFGSDEAFAQLLRDALEKRILIQVAAGDLPAANRTASAMMDQYPEQAAGVIGQVLDGLERQINDLKRQTIGAPATVAQERNEQAARLAEVASEMAGLLLTWAQRQRFDDETMLAYQLPYLKSLRVAGRADAAQAAFEEAGLMANFPQNLAVIVEAGEIAYALGVDEQRAAAGTTYALGDRDTAIRAAQRFDTIITGLQPPYPDAYWNAWLRRLAINLALGQGVDGIPRRVEQLKLTDPNLGGPAFRQQFESLVAAANRAR